MSKSVNSCDAVDGCPVSVVCPLDQVAPGTVCRVRQLLASPDLCVRLREMGFCEHQKIRLLIQQKAMICQVCNARLGISEQLAKSILVEPLALSEKPSTS